jgi:quercetin dioxygenase-like cupin family protein
VETRRFGIGHRRSEGPAGTVGVSAATVHADKLGIIAELALRPNASIAPHSNPNLAYLVVIEGGGFVRVGDETARVAAGEAVVWPPDVIHAAWTETTPMRAIVVEFTLRPDADAIVPIEAEAARPPEGNPVGDEPVDISKAEGSLAPVPEPPPARRVSPDGEPW